MTWVDTHPDPVLSVPRTLRGLAWALGGAAVRYALAGSSTFILTQLLVPADFGLFALTMAAQLLIAHIIPSGFHDALIQRPKVTETDLDAVFWSTITLSALATVTIALAAYPFAVWADLPTLAPMLVVVSLGAFLRALSTVPRALLNRRIEFRTLAFVRVTAMLVAAVGAIVLAYVGAGAWSLIAQVIILHLMSLVCYAWFVRWRPSTLSTRVLFHNMWSFAGAVALFTALAWIVSQADDQLIGLQLGPDALGPYVLASSLIGWIVIDVVGGAAGVLYPVFARLQAVPAQLRQAYLNAIRFAALATMPFLAYLVVAAPVVIPWLLGDKWRAAVLPMQLLALGGLREVTMMFNGPVYRALDRPHLHLMLQIVSIACFLTAFVVGLPFGIGGVAFFYVVTGILLHPLSLWLVSAQLQLSFRGWLRAVAPGGASALVGSGIAFLVMRLLADGGASQAVQVSVSAVVVIAINLAVAGVIVARTDIMQTLRITNGTSTANAPSTSLERL